jgi:hypothetical protein
MASRRGRLRVLVLLRRVTGSRASRALLREVSAVHLNNKGMVSLIRRALRKEASVRRALLKEALVLKALLKEALVLKALRKGASVLKALLREALVRRALRKEVSVRRARLPGASVRRALRKEASAVLLNNKASVDTRAPWALLPWAPPSAPKPSPRAARSS